MGFPPVTTINTSDYNDIEGARIETSFPPIITNIQITTVWKNIRFDRADSPPDLGEQSVRF